MTEISPSLGRGHACGHRSRRFLAGRPHPKKVLNRSAQDRPLSSVQDFFPTGSFGRQKQEDKYGDKQKRGT